MSSSDLDPTPGEGVAALSRRGATMPPPPPLQTVPPAEQPKQQPSPTPEVVETLPSIEPSTANEPAGEAAKPKSKNTPRDKTARKATKLVDPLKGELQRINTRLPIPTRELLEQVRDREETSLGEAAMAAVRQHHKTLREQHTETHVDDGFAAPRKRRAQHRAGLKVGTQILVTAEEGEALQQLAEQIGWSVNRVIITSIDAIYG